MNRNIIITLAFGFVLPGCHSLPHAEGSAPHITAVRFHEWSWRGNEQPNAKALREAIGRSIRVDVERATVWPPPRDNDRVMAATSVRIDDAPCDLAFEVVWPEISSETFGVIWARKGEVSTFRPVRMLVRSSKSAWTMLWPPTHLRTVDVLLRPSQPHSYPIDPETGAGAAPRPENRLDLMHAGMQEAWSEGVIVIEDVPMVWLMRADAERVGGSHDQ